MTGAAPLQLVPLLDNAPDQGLISKLASALEDYLREPVSVLDPLEVPDHAWRDGRLCSNDVVDVLVERFPHEEGYWTVAITSLDLTAPGRDFVFGEAALGGAWAVVSTARLDSDPPAGALQGRLFKEVLHELGHLGGLGHCSRASCVMCRSATVEAVDGKSPDFCEECISAFFQSARS